MCQCHIAHENSVHSTAPSPQNNGEQLHRDSLGGRDHSEPLTEVLILLKLVLDCHIFEQSFSGLGHFGFCNTASYNTGPHMLRTQRDGYPWRPTHQWGAPVDSHEHHCSVLLYRRFEMSTAISSSYFRSSFRMDAFQMKPKLLSAACHL